MKPLIWGLRLALFVVLLGLALHNTDTATLKLFFGLSWQAPLILIVFVFFAAGLLLGVLGTGWRRHRHGSRRGKP